MLNYTCSQSVALKGSPSLKLRRYGAQSAAAAAAAAATSCDTCDAPLTPASLAGIDHRDLENRPLTRSVTRATMFDEPPEK